jgi:hypothetical protein
MSDLLVFRVECCRAEDLLSNCITALAGIYNHFFMAVRFSISAKNIFKTFLLTTQVARI